MKTVFMGTPDFALEALKALHSKHEVICVYTQPPRPSGRGHKLTPSPVQQYAEEHNIPVRCPPTFKPQEEKDAFCALNADIAVVAAYGLLLPKACLNAFKYGCINIHGSLLPRWRGAAPIQRAIMAGDTETGVTLMQMDAGMDTGDMLAKAEVEITPEMTMGELHDSLKEIGGKLLLETVEKIKRGEITPVKQNDDEATYAHLLTRDMEAIDWNLPAAEIHNKIRAFNPAPGAFTNLPGGKKLKIWRAEVACGSGTKAGEVTEVLKNGFKVACGSGVLLVTEVQPESKKRMPAAVFCNGRGDILS